LECLLRVFGFPVFVIDFQGEVDIEVFLSGTTWSPKSSTSYAVV
jgi:hypothetical protein